jgi:acyl-coenzyme A thioesterase PaaI-like protein
MGGGVSAAVQDYYPDDFAWCFGCGRLNRGGHQFKTRPMREQTRTDFTPSRQHSALPGFVYGGLIASLVDCHSTGSAAIFALRDAGEEVGAGEAPRFVTAHLEIDYLHPTPVGELRVLGRMVEIGERKVVVDSEVIAGGEVTARGHAVLVKVPGGADL